MKQQLLFLQTIKVRGVLHRDTKMDLDFSVIVEHLDIDDLCTLFFVNKIWRNWIEQNLHSVAAIHELTPKQTFQELYTSSWQCSAEPDWMNTGKYVCLEFVIKKEIEDLDYYDRRYAISYLRILISPENECTEIDDVPVEDVTVYKRGISTLQQYLFLDKRLGGIRIEYLKHSLSFATNVRLFKFLVKKIDDISGQVFDTVHKSMEEHNYELTLYLLEEYDCSSIMFFEKEFANFCADGTFDLPSQDYSEHVQLVTDQTSCTESEAVRALNMKRGDVVNAIMSLPYVSGL